MKKNKGLNVGMLVFAIGISMLLSDGHWAINCIGVLMSLIGVMTILNADGKGKYDKDINALIKKEEQNDDRA